MAIFNQKKEFLFHILVALSAATLAFLLGRYVEGHIDAFVVIVAVFVGVLLLLAIRWYSLYQQARVGQRTSSLISDILHGKGDGFEASHPSVPTCWKIRQCCYPQCPVFGREHVRCWLVDGTFCRGEADGRFPGKLDYCNTCEVFLQAVRDDPARAIEERFHGVIQLLGDREKKAADLYQRSETQRQMLEYLLNVSRQALSSLELDDLLSLLMRQIIGPSADFAAFFIRSQDDKLVLHASEGFKPGVHPRLADENGDDFVDAVIAGNVPVVSRAIAREPWIRDQFIREGIPTSVIGVPLVSRDRQLGLLLAGTFRDQPYSEAEKQVFQVAGSQIAMAVANAHMYEAVTLMAATDGLTGLANHRAFYEALEKELGRSRRYGRPLSLIMIDIDHFKQFNDTFGHPQGDKVLTEIAKIIRDSVRVVDTAARYGGEEFAVLLPETPYEASDDVAGSALQVAERMRVAVEGHAFEGRPGLRDARITISLGVAEHPAHAEGLTDIVYAADAALYEAKRKGRNRVELASESSRRHGVASLDE